VTIKDLIDLPPEQRAAKYRALAGDVEEWAAKAATPAARESYLLLAEQWRALAAQVEAESIHISDARHIGIELIPKTRPDTR